MAEDKAKKSGESRDIAENIIKSMVDSLIVVDQNATIITVNQAMCELLGYRKEELISKSAGIIFEEEVTPFKGTRMKKLIEQGSIRDYEITCKTKSAEKIPVSFSGSVMRDKTGEMIGIVGIARNMRETKRLIQAEKDLAIKAGAATAAERRRVRELKEIKASLEIKVQERTIELSKLNAELAKKMKTVEKLNKCMFGRELRIIEVKQEVNALLEKLGKKVYYAKYPDDETKARVNKMLSEVDESKEQ